MNNSLQSQLLQHFAKKKSNAGFTLIELLVVIIIVGILSAIALPTFLNQASKARESEAKTNLGVLNRAQQAYRVENGSFASSIGNLDASVSDGIYSYAVQEQKKGNSVTHFADIDDSNLESDINHYCAGVNDDGDSEVVSEADNSDYSDTSNCTAANLGI